jgi:DNA-binding transcriptional MerR regulator
VANKDQQYSLTELTEAAGVSARTVRYYIGEGLLPPPVVAGPRSYYTSDHLNRLKIVGHMKDAYLPLKEVRKRLSQLNEDQIARLGQTIAVRSNPEDQPLDSAADYIARALGQPPSARAETPPPATATPLMMGKYEFHAHEPVEKSIVTPEQAESWRRIQLGDEAELLIREEAYQRNRDRIEWLMDWAKRVFR